MLKISQASIQGCYPCQRARQILSSMVGEWFEYEYLDLYIPEDRRRAEELGLYKNSVPMFYKDDEIYDKNFMEVIQEVKDYINDKKEEEK